MRILHVDAGREMRGGQWQAVYLMEALRDLGIEQTLGLRTGSLLEVVAGARQLETRRVSPVTLAALAARYDLVHVHDAKAHTWASLAPRPVVVSRRVAFPVGEGRLSRWKYGRAARYIAVSECVKKTLVDGGIPDAKVDVVPDGVPLPPRPGRGSRILAPATEDPRKGSALVRLAATMAGVNIHFSDNLPEDLKDARLLVYISEMEGFGSGALLAMAHGIPVIASAVGGLVEMIEDGETGLLVENRPEAIVNAIQLLEDDLLADRVGENARKLVEERFTAAHMAQRTLEVYRKVLGC